MTKGTSARFEPIARVTMPADDINFDATYQFEVTQGDRVYLWSGAKADRVGSVAVFDWKDGANGMLVEMSATSRRFLP